MSEPTEEQKWACVAKALDEFEGDKLGRRYLRNEGTFCAVGAVLHVAKVEAVETIRPIDVGLHHQLYKEFEKIFKIPASELYITNDTAPGGPEGRLEYMRSYAKARARGMDWDKAEMIARLEFLNGKKSK